jgi:D-alanyl-D-alanine carboxypeptidase (penicillin-binding protein 5/6)
MKGSQALLDANAVYTLEDLLRTTIMASANDSAVALAEYLSGSEEAFVARMNARARELGMTNTMYVNCTGYPKEGQYTTARDVSTLCCEVAKHPKYHEYSSVWIDKLTHPGGRVTDLTNTNRLVRFYHGCDGFKTGSTDAAKYCLAATASKNGMRLVAIVLGTPVSQTRFNEARAMLDYGFANYTQTLLYPSATVFDSMSISNGKPKKVDMISKEDIYLVHDKKVNVEHTIEIVPMVVQAPITLNTPIAKLKIIFENGLVQESLLYSNVEVYTLDYIDVIMDCFTKFLF